MTGHQQSVEYQTVAQNKSKLYFNSDSFMNLNEQKQLNQVKELKEEIKTVQGDNFRAEQSSSHNKFDRNKSEKNEPKITKSYMMNGEKNNFYQKEKLNFKYLKA